MLRQGLLLGALLLAANAAAAQDFPSKTVTIVVPASAGGASDVVGRVVADQLRQQWKHPIVIENIGGGAMNIAATQVAKAAADGHTMIVHPPALTFNDLLYKNLSYKPSDFTPITVLAKTPFALLARPTLAANSVKELVEIIKAKPKKMTFGYSGDALRLTALRFADQMGLELTAVPYKGEMAILTDLMAGHIDLVFGTLSTSLPLHRSGKLKMLAVAQLERNKAVSDVPTMHEAGVQNFESLAWFALAAPTGLPPAIHEKINRDVVAALKHPQVGERLSKLLLDPVGQSVEDTKVFFAKEAKLWGNAIRAAKIEPQ